MFLHEEFAYALRGFELRLRFSIVYMWLLITTEPVFFFTAMSENLQTTFSWSKMSY